MILIDIVMTYMFSTYRQHNSHSGLDDSMKILCRKFLFCVPNVLQWRFWKFLANTGLKVPIGGGVYFKDSEEFLRPVIETQGTLLYSLDLFAI